MIFNHHKSLGHSHAFLSPSSYHWINYDIERLSQKFLRSRQSQKGTRLHRFAEECILLRQRLPVSRNSINQYVNDAIGYRMVPELVVMYSPNAFGTVDALSCNDILRIHDLKTGIVPASMKQLEIYAAFFCLEYDFKPEKIEMELRIYQSREIVIHVPDPSVIGDIMRKTMLFDKHINEMIAVEAKWQPT